LNENIRFWPWSTGGDGGGSGGGGAMTCISGASVAAPLV